MEQVPAPHASMVGRSSVNLSVHDEKTFVQFLEHPGVRRAALYLAEYIYLFNRTMKQLIPMHFQAYAHNKEDTRIDLDQDFWRRDVLCHIRLGEHSTVTEDVGLERIPGTISGHFQPLARDIVDHKNIEFIYFK